MFEENPFWPYITFEAANDTGAGGADDDTDGDDPGGDENGIKDLDAAKAEIDKLRRESAKYRTRSKEFDTVKKELDTLKEGLKGIFGEDQDLDPQELKSQTESLQTELKQERIKSSVTIQAVQSGLDPDLTIAYLQNKGAFKDLEPTDGEAVKSLIEGVAKDKPALLVKKADSVGTGGGGNDDQDEGKTLNPIDQWRKDQGIIVNQK